MRYPAAETAKKHDRLVAAAARLFRERGFNGVNVREIMQAAGMTHGAFYSHFDSKEDLTIAATERAFQEQFEYMRLALKSDDPKATYARKYLSQKNRDNLSTGCAIAALSTDVVREPASRKAYTAQIKSVIDFMVAHFRWPGRRPERSQAIVALALGVGALILSRAVDDEQLSQEFLSIARDELS